MLIRQTIQSHHGLINVGVIVPRGQVDDFVVVFVVLKQGFLGDGGRNRRPHRQLDATGPFSGW